MLIRIKIIKEWGAPYILEWIDRAQRAEWDAITQDKIRAIVARMAAINTLIIEFKGDNCFHSQDLK